MKWLMKWMHERGWNAYIFMYTCTSTASTQMHNLEVVKYYVVHLKYGCFI